MTLKYEKKSAFIFVICKQTYILLIGQCYTVSHHELTFNFLKKHHKTENKKIKLVPKIKIIFKIKLNRIYRF